MKSYVRTALIAAGLSALSLTAACHSPAPENQVETTVVNTTEVENTTIDANVSSAATIAPVTNGTAPAKTSDKNQFSSDEQTMQDADATGMTSKLPAENETQPAH